MFFSQLAEKNIHTPDEPNKAILIDKYGNPITTNYVIKNAKSSGGITGGMSKSLETFIASLNWISFKSIYYTKMAEYLKADTFLHPIRQKFQISYLDKTHNFEGDYITSLIDLFSNKTKQTVEEIFSSNRCRNISLELPLFLSHIISKVETPDEVINYALELRNKQEFIDARSQLEEIRNNLEENFQTANVKSQKIYNDLLSTLQRIKKTFGISTPQGILESKTISSINSITALAQKQILIPNFINDNPELSKLLLKLPKKSFSFIYKDIVNDLTQISKLGNYYDMLTSKVTIEKNARVFQPKYENPDFLNANCWWKSPM